ncbi:sensor histidine kinase [Amycolatopsis saalfeldensis]|uniref:histidine kinase n=1 Tax=Amycolatopsis saalfeldensis TaxID=394193 RepID=A0A1H8YJA0_9PSEU|nr:sensor histidine kinase [Amycolatopsis saalfeldensis]SEP52284.1 Signal transduction histidine kinase [Amycolatopsis saalfeldensis]
MCGHTRAGRLGGMVAVLGDRLARPAWSDVVLGAALAVAVVAGTVASSVGQADRSRPVDAVGLVLLVAAAAVTAVPRRTMPLGALAGAVLLVNAYLLAGYPYGPVLLCLVITVFEVARQRPLAVSAAAGGLAAVISSATLLLRLIGDGHSPALLALAWTGWIVLPWSLGALLHVRDAARRRARRDLIARTALEERMRLAGEVHDIAGHGFALVTMQAGVALLVFDEQRDQARLSLEAIQETSIAALADLRRMLDTFHPRSPGPGDPAGVAGLAGLIQQVRAGGLPVEVSTDGPAELPEQLGATVYRVVQEALTNVLRHAGPTRAEVAIHRGDRHVQVRVADRGTGPTATAPAGRGLAGMRRRVEELDGRLAAGPRDGGGFQVVAWLPAPEPAR